MESMQDKVRLLHAANERLRGVIRAYLPPEESTELIGENTGLDGGDHEENDDSLDENDDESALVQDASSSTTA
jgi:hypothetical protein